MRFLYRRAPLRMDNLCTFDQSPCTGVSEGVEAMLDIIFIGLSLLLFGLMAAYVIACDKL